MKRKLISALDIKVLDSMRICREGFSVKHLKSRVEAQMNVLGWRNKLGILQNKGNISCTAWIISLKKKF